MIAKLNFGGSEHRASRQHPRRFVLAQLGPDVALLCVSPLVVFTLERKHHKFPPIEEKRHL